MHLINSLQHYTLRTVDDSEAYTFRYSGLRGYSLSPCLPLPEHTTHALPRHKVDLFRSLLEQLSEIRCGEGRDREGPGSMAVHYDQLLQLELRQLLHPKKSCRRSKVVAHFRNLVRQHYRTEKALAFYASQLCISENHLYKIVKQTTGQLPSWVIQEQLVREAKYQLVYTTRNIKTIAFGLNFTEVPYFIRLFKKHSGVTPGRYRKLYGNWQDMSNKRQDVYYDQRAKPL